MTLQYEKDGGLEYPVKPGETWTVGSEATLICGDLMEDWILSRLVTEQPDLIYCDPPWGAALASGFRTKAGVGGKANYPKLLVRVFILVRRLGVPSYFENGVKWTELMRNIAQQQSVIPHTTWDITYYKKHAATLTAFDFHPATELPDYTGMDDDFTPGLAIDTHTKRGDLVLDPMTGRGLTAVSAIERSRRFVGSELSPYRASVTLRKLSDLTGRKAERIG